MSRRSDALVPLVHILGRILGRIDADGGVEVWSVARLETRYLVGDGVDSGYRAQLVGEDGRVVTEDVVYRYPNRGGCGGGVPDRSPCGGDRGDEREFVFKAMLDDRAPGQSLRIHRGKEVVWTRSGPESPPTIGDVRATVDEGGAVRVTWSVRRHGNDAQDSWIRWSDDDGKTWHALTVVASGDFVEVPPDQLPSGSVRFQILAHDGFFTALAASAAIEIPEAPPIVTVLYPRVGDRVYAERQLHLWAAAASRGRESIADDSFSWFIDGEDVGHGADIWVNTPKPGRHEVRVEVAGRAGTGHATSTVEVPSTRT